MTRTMIVAVAVWLATSALGCKPHDELVVDVVCAAVCPCLPDPSDRAECEVECPSQLNPGSVSDECFGCVLEAADSCPSIFACDPVCSF